MPLHANSELLRQTLEAESLLDGRFSNLKLVNVSAAGVKRGCFSLVFKAYDVAAGKHVALKFFDLDPAWSLDSYRTAAFRREHEILQTLLGNERCLQLASPFSIYTLLHEVSGVKDVEIRCPYFAIDWLEEDIDKYFLEQETVEAAVKLKLFNEIVLAVESLQAHKVFHRDLKADNLRAFQGALKKIVVAIDLGTAARYDSGCIGAPYAHTAGAPAYSSPEAMCGLTANRILAPFNDSYALGCLLYEMFNPNYFYAAVRDLNPHLDVRFAGMAGFLQHGVDEKTQFEDWKVALSKYSPGVSTVPINGVGSTVPPGVAPLLNEILEALTNVDFRKRRFGTRWVRQRLQSAIKVLENEALYQRRLAQVKEQRRKRLEVVAQKVSRHQSRLKLRKEDANPHPQAA